jgi:hypothetical protein
MDGEYTGNFPTGDGQVGGDFRFQFVVDTPPVVQQVAASRVQRHHTTVSIQISEPVDVSQGAIASYFDVWRAGKDGVFGTRDDRKVHFRAKYIADMNGPSLSSLRFRRLHDAVQVTIHSLKDLTGNPIIGGVDSQSGLVTVIQP